MSRCEDVMTRNPICCVASDSIQLAAQKMEQRNIGALPVVDHDTAKLIGIVTDRDLALRVIGKGLETATTNVGYIMTLDVIMCRPSDPLEKVMGLMSEWQIRRVPVVDEMGYVIGIISQADIATRLQDETWAGAVVREISQPS